MFSRERNKQRKQRNFVRKKHPVKTHLYVIFIEYFPDNCYEMLQKEARVVIDINFFCTIIKNDIVIRLQHVRTEHNIRVGWKKLSIKFELKPTFYCVPIKKKSNTTHVCISCWERSIRCIDASNGNHIIYTCFIFMKSTPSYIHYYGRDSIIHVVRISENSMFETVPDSFPATWNNSRARAVGSLLLLPPA